MSLQTLTINTIDYVSYASVTEADNYLAVDAARASTWAALTVDQKSARLVQAVRVLDQYDWAAAKTGADDVQENAWPRTGMLYSDSTTVATDEVPVAIANASILIAADIALDASKGDSIGVNENIKRSKAGSAEIEYFQPGQEQNAPSYILRLISIFLAGNQPTTEEVSNPSVGEAYGTDETSYFSEFDDFARSGGLG